MEESEYSPSGDSHETPLSDAGIVMLSAPETQAENQNADTAPVGSPHNVFLTPPELNPQHRPVASTADQDQTVEIAGSGEDTEVLDLGTETEGEFPQEAREAYDKEVSHCQYVKSGFPFKRSRIELEERLNRSVNSSEKLDSKSKQFNACDACLRCSRDGTGESGRAKQSPQKFQNRDGEHNDESVAKRKLEFSKEALESEFQKKEMVSENSKIGDDGEANGMRNAREECLEKRSMDDIDEFRDAGSIGLKNCEKQSKAVICRVLPLTISEKKDDAGGGKMECGKVLPLTICEKKDDARGRETECGKVVRLRVLPPTICEKKDDAQGGKTKCGGDPCVKKGNAGGGTLECGVDVSGKKDDIGVGIMESSGHVSAKNDDIGRGVMDSGSDILPRQSYKEKMLGWLRRIPKKDKVDPSLKILSLLEIAKKRGMTFP